MPHMCLSQKKHEFVFIKSSVQTERNKSTILRQAENSSSLYLIFVSSSASISQVLVVSEMLKKQIALRYDG